MKREILSGSAVMKLLQAKKPRNKYGVSDPSQRTWNGVLYGSKGEMEKAQELDMLLCAGKLRSVDRQFPLRMVVGGKLVCTHLVDFRVIDSTGALFYIEFKGTETPVYRLKMKLLEACYPGIMGHYQIHKKR